MTKPLKLPTQERLHELLDYDPDTGEFTWKVKPAPRIKVGDVAGCLDKDSGYFRIRVDGTLYRSHRLVWRYVHGGDPGNLEVDHINKNTSDNRIANLRLATHQQNTWNNSGLGVSWHKRARKWRARIKVDKVSKYLGCFKHYFAAVYAYQQARVKYFGEFA